MKNVNPICKGCKVQFEDGQLVVAVQGKLYCESCNEKIKSAPPKKQRDLQASRQTRVSGELVSFDFGAWDKMENGNTDEFYRVWADNIPCWDFTKVEGGYSPKPISPLTNKKMGAVEEGMVFTTRRELIEWLIANTVSANGAEII